MTAISNLTIKDIEDMVIVFSNKLGVLKSACQEQIDRIKKIEQTMHRHITEATADAAMARENLRKAVEQNPHLFEKPKTVTLCGIRVGVMKQKGKVTFDDESKVIARIRTKLPKDQAELLIRTTEQLHKPGVYDLTASDLKRLGIRIEDDCDAIVIKPSADSDSGKMAATLIEHQAQSGA